MGSEGAQFIQSDHLSFVESLLDYTHLRINVNVYFIIISLDEMLTSGKKVKAG